MIRALIQRHRVSLLFLFWITVLVLFLVSGESTPLRKSGSPAGRPGEKALTIERFIRPQPSIIQPGRQETSPVTNTPQPGSDQSDWYAASQLDDLPRPLVSLEQLFVFPEKAALLGIHKALVLAEIDLDAGGWIRSCRIVRGAGNGFDEEVLAKLPGVPFTPGRIDGKPVPVRARLPVRFVLGTRH